MEKAVLNVEGMSCEHCVKAVTGAVGALAGVDTVSVDLDAKTVTVVFNPDQCALDEIKTEIDDQGYTIV